MRGVVRRGLRPLPSKASISLRVDQDVLEWFKAQGRATKLESIRSCAPFGMHPSSDQGPRPATSWPRRQRPDRAWHVGRRLRGPTRRRHHCLRQSAVCHVTICPCGCRGTSRRASPSWPDWVRAAQCAFDGRRPTASGPWICSCTERRIGSRNSRAAQPLLGSVRVPRRPLQTPPLMARQTPPGRTV